MKKITDFKWLIYPLIVGVFILVSSQYLFDVNKWDVLAQDRNKIAAQEKQIADLRSKLSILASVDPISEEQNLKYLVSAMPNSKMVWFLVSEIKLAASDSGALLDEFEGEIGTGVAEQDAAASPAAVTTAPDTTLRIAASLRLKDLAALKAFVTSLNNRMPLVKVEQLDYQSGVTKLVVQGAWSPSKRVVSDQSELPDYRPGLVQAKKGLEGLVGFPEVIIKPVGTNPVTDPF